MIVKQIYTKCLAQASYFIESNGEVEIIDPIRAINEYIELPNNSEDICTPCEKPCLTACPVSALNQDGYDVIRCKEYLHTRSGQECRDGCLVRRSCPSGQNLRLKEQSNFHMRAFLSD